MEHASLLHGVCVCSFDSTPFNSHPPLRKQLSVPKLSCVPFWTRFSGFLHDRVAQDVPFISFQGYGLHCLAMSKNCGLRFGRSSNFNFPLTSQMAIAAINTYLLFNIIILYYHCITATMDINPNKVKRFSHSKSDDSDLTLNLNFFPTALSFDHFFTNTIMTTATPTHESLDEIISRHRKEAKELTAKITALRKDVPKGDKKKVRCGCNATRQTLFSKQTACQLSSPEKVGHPFVEKGSARASRAVGVGVGAET